jgi:hypothetical protein
MNNEGWRPEDKAPPTGEWIMVHTGRHGKPEWFPVRLAEGGELHDEEGQGVKGPILWWRYFFSGETPPAS